LFFNETVCLKSGKKLNDGRRSVSVLIRDLYPQMKATPFWDGRLQAFKLGDGDFNEWNLLM
jgi:hypothetical protein